MKKTAFLVILAVLFTANTAFSQTPDKKLPKKPKKIRVSDIVTYGLPDSLELSPSRPLPAVYFAQHNCIPRPILEITEERFIMIIHEKPQIIQITSGPNGTILVANFTKSNESTITETFELGYQSRFTGLRHSEDDYGLIHLSYQDRYGITRFIDFYIP